MHTQEECAGVEAVLVAVADEVDVLEVARRKEDVEGDGGIYKDQVGVDPPVLLLA